MEELGGAWPTGLERAMGDFEGAIGFSRFVTSDSSQNGCYAHPFKGPDDVASHEAALDTSANPVQIQPAGAN